MQNQERQKGGHLSIQLDRNELRRSACPLRELWIPLYRYAGGQIRKTYRHSGTGKAGRNGSSGFAFICSGGKIRSEMLYDRRIFRRTEFRVVHEWQDYPTVCMQAGPRTPWCRNLPWRERKGRTENCRRRQPTSYLVRSAPDGDKDEICPVYRLHRVWRLDVFQWPLIRCQEHGNQSGSRHIRHRRAVYRGRPCPGHRQGIYEHSGRRTSQVQGRTVREIPGFQACRAPLDGL